ncbi:DUF1192 domain-containing protein [Thalassospira marina]|uniref:DUF1192 domain-containing protein n=1 Tax=Thalassospira marina TaxID=2048283 RepID=A0A2N3KB35_9PROT|nr:DUF1192 domain-containing protein [Thalassospira marina]AUG53510.1 hypothetical protein CSC3H3_12910 [Thalassospira marina]PKR47751.1 hypothetical protein COO20_25465 [Thalassospira marina]
MDQDDLLASAAAGMPVGIPRNLDDMSVENLLAYKTALLTEIERVEQTLVTRDGVRKGAEALFRT